MNEQIILSLILLATLVTGIAAYFMRDKSKDREKEDSAWWG